MTDLAPPSPAEPAPVVSQSAALFEASVREAMVEDVSQIIRVTPWLERCPVTMWRREPGLFSELAEAVDRLAAKVGKVKEALGEDR